MKRYPYILEMWYEEDGYHDPADGSWHEGFSEWRKVDKCNVRQNGNSREIILPDGVVTKYSYEIILPAKEYAIADKTKVRVIGNGINLFDSMPLCESSKTYNVQGSNLMFRQRYENARLWL